MAVSHIAGSNVVVETSANASSQSITVPAGATLAVITAGAYCGAVTYGSPTFTLAGSACTRVEGGTPGGDFDAAILEYAVSPAAGSATLAWSVPTLSVSTLKILVAFYSGSDTATPIGTHGRVDHNSGTTGAETVSGLTAPAGSLTVGIAVSDLMPDMTGGSQTVVASSADTAVRAALAHKAESTSLTAANLTFGMLLAMVILPTAGPPPQYARPATDVSAGPWTPSTGASLAGTIDETTPSDTDYNAATANGTFRVDLGAVSTPDAGTRTVRFRVAGSPAKKLIATLIEGAGAAIASTTIDPLPASVTAQSFTVSNAIGNYGDLDLSFEVADATAPPTPAVSFGAIGTGANGSTSVVVPVPAGIVAGNYLTIEIASGATNNETPSTPAGWSLLATGASTDGTFGIDTGPRRATVFGKPAVGGETAVTVTITNGNTARGTMTRWVKSQPTYTWSVVAQGAANSTSGTGVSMTTAAIDWAVGDCAEVVVGQRVDSATQSAQSLTAAGTTFGARTNRSSVAVTTGNDVRHVVDTFAAVTVGGGSAPTTWAYTASAAVSAGGVVVRLREVPPTEFARVTFTEFEVPAAPAGGSNPLTANLAGVPSLVSSLSTSRLLSSSLASSGSISSTASVVKPLAVIGSAVPGLSSSLQVGAAAAPLIANLLSSSLISPAVTVGKPLSSALLSSGQATAGLGVARPLQSSFVAQSGSTQNLGLGLSLSLSTSVSSTLTSVLDSAGANNLTQSLVSASAVTSDPAVSKPLQCASGAQSLLAASPSVARLLVSGVAAQSACLSGLTLTKGLAATAEAQSASTSTLSISLSLSTALTCAASAPSLLAVGRAVSSVLSCVSALNSTTSIAGAYSANFSGVGSLSSSLAVGKPLAASFSASASAAVDVQVSKGLASALSSSGSLVGALGSVGGLLSPFSASSALASNVVVLRPLSVTLSASSGTATDLAVARALAAATSAQASLTAYLGINAPLAVSLVAGTGLSNVVSISRGLAGPLTSQAILSSAPTTLKPLAAALASVGLLSSVLSNRALLDAESMPEFWINVPIEVRYFAPETEQRLVYVGGEQRFVAVNL